ncbi:MAG TPA: hypothetical protein VGK49_08205 [Ilumatobacteraceae bacterium]
MTASRATELRIGDSSIIVAQAGERDQHTAFLYLYVDDADATFERAVSAARPCSRSRSTRPMATTAPWCETPPGTCSRSPTESRTDRSDHDT